MYVISCPVNGYPRMDDLAGQTSLLCCAVSVVVDETHNFWVVNPVNLSRLIDCNIYRYVMFTIMHTSQ